MDQSDSVLTNVVSVTQSQQWTVQIGQCPQFTSHYIATSSSRNSVWIYIAVIIVGGVVAMVAVVLSVFSHEKDTNLRIAIAQHEESSRAHRWIIGYGM